MKSTTFLSNSLFLILFLFSLSSKAQEILIGDWMAKCVIEKTSASSMRFNSFCRYAEVDEASMRFIPFEMRFSDVLEIYENNEFYSVDYQYDSMVNKLTFNYKDEDFDFNVLIVNNGGLILKDEEGSMMYLDRKQ